MARIFISHSSRDVEPAQRMKDWLNKQGYERVFLDFDKHGGFAPGATWEKTLYSELERSEAVIIILTPNWLDSKWCFAEFTQARALGKAIFPVIETPVGDRFISPDIQHLDLMQDREGGLDRLSRELTSIALDAQGGFAWTTTRSPYPGLLSFQEEDAAIYFGRDDDIRRVIERLNARRAQGGPKLIAILGASGSGKSSLIRAGVIPRLKRDLKNWIVLPTLRPQTFPLDELAAVFAASAGDTRDWRIWVDRLRGLDIATAFADFARQVRADARAHEACIVLPIDQAEELFGAADPEQSTRFLKVLSVLLAPETPFMAAMAVRSDYLGHLQSADALTARFEEFSLGPLPMSRVPQVIEGPAKVAGFRIEEGLVAQVLKDMETDDALPLLAYALRELYERFGASGRLRLEDYLSLGDKTEQLTPLENAVRRGADNVLNDARPSDDELHALRQAFMPNMVRVNQDGEFVRRQAHWNALPEKAHSLLMELAKARLLVIDQAGDKRVVEVAHEALLRKWPQLRNWLDEERDFLQWHNQIEDDRRTWEKAPSEHKESALLGGYGLVQGARWMQKKSNALRQENIDFILASLPETFDFKYTILDKFLLGGIVAVALILVLFGTATKLAILTNPYTAIPFVLTLIGVLYWQFSRISKKRTKIVEKTFARVYPEEVRKLVNERKHLRLSKAR